MWNIFAYLYGHEFTLITDNKPFELLYKNPQSRPSSRIERWCLRLQEYLFHIKYRPGSKNPSDHLSRPPFPTTSTPSPLEVIAENHVRLTTESAIPVAVDIECVRNVTKQDPTLSKDIEFIQANKWTTLEKPKEIPLGINIDELHALFKLRDELTVSSEADILLRGNRVVIPSKLRAQAVKLAHEGHQGLVKNKRLIREKVWFYQIDSYVEECIKKCLPCQSVTRPKSPRSLQTIQIPKNPWDTVYIDFLGPFPSEELLLVVIDGRTRFSEVEIVKSTSASSTIPRLDRIFSTHGLPQKIITDNGPPFTSYEI